MLLWPCHTDVEQPPRFAKPGRSAAVAFARDVAGVDAIHDDGVELPALGAMQGAEIYASRTFDTPREVSERKIEISCRNLCW